MMFPLSQVPPAPRAGGAGDGGGGVGAGRTMGGVGHGVVGVEGGVAGGATLGVRGGAARSRRGAADPRRGSGSKAEATHPAGDKEYAEPAHIRGVSASAKEKGLSPKEQSS